MSNVNFFGGHVSQQLTGGMKKIYYLLEGSQWVPHGISARLEGGIPGDDGPAHGAVLRGGDQLLQDLPVVQMRDVPDVRGDEPVREAVNLERRCA